MTAADDYTVTLSPWSVVPEAGPWWWCGCYFWLWLLMVLRMIEMRALLVDPFLSLCFQWCFSGGSRVLQRFSSPQTAPSIDQPKYRNFCPSLGFVPALQANENPVRVIVSYEAHLAGNPSRNRSQRLIEQLMECRWLNWVRRDEMITLRCLDILKKRNWRLSLMHGDREFVLWYRKLCMRRVGDDFYNGSKPPSRTWILRDNAMRWA